MSMGGILAVLEPKRREDSKITEDLYTVLTKQKKPTKQGCGFFGSK